MTDKRGNQTGHELDLPDGQGTGDLFNPGHSPQSGAPRSGLVDIDAEQDISDGAKVTLGKYLSDLTAGRAGTKGSRFVTPAEPGPALADYDPNASSRGGPAAGRLMQEEGRTDGTYIDVVESLDPDAARLFRMTGDGDHGGANPFLETGVSDYGSQRRVSEGLTGHTALPGIRPSGSPGSAQLGNPAIGPTPGDAPVLQQKVSSILSSNRFSQVERAFVMNSERTGTGVSLQGSLGQNDRQAPELEREELTGIGGALLDRAAGQAARLELGSTGLPLSPEAPIDLRATGAPIIPASQLRAGRTVGGTSETADYTNLDDTLSYSVLNTDTERFTGGPLGVVSEATLNVVRVGIVKVLAYAETVRGALRATAALESRSPSRQGLEARVLRALDLPPLRAGGKETLDWHSRFILGMEEFYGVEDIRSDLLEIARRVQTAPGYYTSVARNAMRDLPGLTDVVSSVQSSLRGGSVTSQAADIAASRLTAALEGVGTAATWRFIVAMVTLGDRRLLGNSVLEDRLRTRAPGQPLSWRHQVEGRATYVLPSSLTQAGRQLSEASGRSSTLLTVPGGRSYEGRRFSSLEVQKIEDRLEGEYVPFYFHDVRTNEVIAFHAFLSSLTDGFAANYNSTTGYGRAEDVMVYNNTKRSIGFDFHLVATSKDDHDALYWNVNKLVSMLYPQYSRGRTVVSGDQRFIQPFSQIPTASPLVRIRIGDVVKSNYSRFGLARLFGLGQDSQAFSVSAAAESAAASEEAERLAQEDTEREVTRLRSEGPNVGEEVELRVPVQPSRLQDSNGNPITSDRIAFTGLIQAASEGPEAGTQAEPRRRSRNRGLPPPLQQLSVSSATVLEVTPIGDDPGTVAVRLELASIRADVAEGSVTLDGASSPRIGDILGEFRYLEIFVPIGDTAGDTLTFTPAQRDRVLNQKRQERGAEPPTSNSSDAVRDFFNPGTGTSGNPIVRSFESSRGRGMAGFITGMTMDWADSTWEIDKGSRAPISLKISVTFSPIHDIPLGLDSDGAMRAVAYGVGRHSNALGGDPYDGSE